MHPWNQDISSNQDTFNSFRSSTVLHYFKTLLANGLHLGALYLNYHNAHVTHNYVRIFQLFLMTRHSVWGFAKPSLWPSVGLASWRYWETLNATCSTLPCSRKRSCQGWWWSGRLIIFDSTAPTIWHSNLNLEGKCIRVLCVCKFSSTHLGLGGWMKLYVLRITRATYMQWNLSIALWATKSGLYRGQEQW